MGHFAMWTYQLLWCVSGSDQEKWAHEMSKMPRGNNKGYENLRLILYVMFYVLCFMVHIIFDDNISISYKENISNGS